MLKEEARRERQWGSFPALRKVLEGKPDPSEPIFSTDETFGEEICRLLQIWRLVQHYDTQIKEFADSGDRDQTIEDLRHLEQQLQAANHYIKAAIGQIDALCAML